LQVDSINEDIPSEVSVGTVFTVTCTIQNLTMHFAELVAFVEASDAFVFAGYKQMAIRILPLASCDVRFRLLPLQPGRRALPLLRLLKRSDAMSMGEGGNNLSLSKVEGDKCFPISVAEVHKFGSKNGEFFVHVYPQKEQ
jgi:hypothetical protein